MKRKQLTAVCMALMLLLFAAAALAQPEIITPYEQQILPVSGGMVTFEWVPQEEPMDLFIVDAEQTVIFQQTVEPGVPGMSVPASGMLQEGKPYLLVLMIGDDAAGAAFGVDMGGGRASSVDWSSGPSGGSAGGSGYGAVTFNTENLEGLTKLMVDMYNAILERMAELSKGYTVSNSRGVEYGPGEEGALLGPLYLRLRNSNGFFPRNEKSMIEYTDTVFEILENDYAQLKELGYLEDDGFPMISSRYIQLMEGTLEGGVAVEPLHYHNGEDGVVLMLFGLTDEKGKTLLDENIYGHFCVMDSDGKLVSLIITEQEEISKLIDELGIDRNELMAKLPEVMELGFTPERLMETLKTLAEAGAAQKGVQTATGTDYNAAARDGESAVGQQYKRILWDRMDGVYDDVLDLLIQEKTAEELAPNIDWQMAMYKSSLYEMLGQNTEGIGETTAIVLEYLTAVREAYQLANSAASVDEAVAALNLPQEETWARLLSLVLENADLAVQSEEDLAVIACLIAEQTVNEAVLDEIAAAVGEEHALYGVCAEVKAETNDAIAKAVKTLGAPVMQAMAEMESGKRIAQMRNVTANALSLAEMNAEKSALGDLYAFYGVSVVMDEMEASLPIGERLIQMNLIREDLRALVEAAYQAEDEKAAALYPLTKLYLIVEARCLTETENYFASVEGSWFASTFMHETVTDAKSAQAAVDASREEVQTTGRTLRDQRTQTLSARQKESNVVLGRNRTAIVNTSKSPLTMTAKPEKKGGTICNIPKGETVVVLEEGQWPLVEYNGKQGYVNGQYLKY